MTALQAASAGVKDMADGSLRITIEFEPRFAKDAFALFGSRGTQLAVAALKDGSFLEQPVAEPIPPNSRELKPREQLGRACYRTVMWCNEPSFWDFLTNAGFFDTKPTVTNKDEAANLVRYVCNVESRKELDTNNEANKTWIREIRQPYADYLKRQEAV